MTQKLWIGKINLRRPGWRKDGHREKEEGGIKITKIFEKATGNYFMAT